ncbi:MAG: PAS domain S-box protein [Dehalococcoidia bacterium]
MPEAETFDLIRAKRREQVPQALARLVVIGLFIVLWVNLWVARIPMPAPFLLVLVAEACFFVCYWRAIHVLRSLRALDAAQNLMLVAEIVFHTTIVYFLGSVSWLGPFAYVFGMIFANTFLGMRRGLLYTVGATTAFAALVMLEANGVVPHYVYMDQGPLRYTDPQFVATTIVGGFGVFLSIYVWVNWVGSELRHERDAAVKAQEGLLEARAALQQTNEELEQRVADRTRDLELANAALRQSEERLRTVISNAPVILFASNAHGIFTVSEGQGLEALGLEPGQVIGRSAFDLFRNNPAVCDNVRRVLAGEAFTAEIEIRGLCFEAHHAPVRDEHGNVVGMIGVASDVTERKRTEDALRESEERLRTVVSNAPVVLFAVDSEGIFTLSEGKGLEALGLKPGEVVGSSVYEMYRDAPEICNNIRRALGGEAFTAAVAISGLGYETHHAPVRDRQGNVIGMIGVASDVTERMKAERELRAREARNRALLEAIPDMIVRIRKDGTVLDFKPQHDVELSIDDPIGRNIYEFLLGEVGAGAKEHIERALETHVSQLYEFPLDGAHDEERHREARIVACADDEVLALVRDVTERKRTEEALLESEAKFRTLAETAATAVFVFQDTTIRYVNPAGEAQTGYSEEELLTMDFWEVIHPEHRQLVKQRGLARQAGDDVPSGYEVKLLTKDGEERWVEFTAGVIEYQGQPAVVGTAFDITERKRIEEALREQALRDPLTGVLNHAAIVQELRAVLDSGADGVSHVIVMADVDGLKAINDIYGHQMGDEALTLVARVLQQDDAIVGRYGGDEFVAVLREHDRASADRYRATVLDRLANARLIDPETSAEIPIIVSLGYAIHPADARTVHDLIQVSDNAMYAAKRQRPTHGRDPTFVRPLGTDRAAELVGQLVPLLTAPGDVNDKLKLVAQRLSVGAGYDAVTFSMFAPLPGQPLAENTFARAPEELVEAWHTVQDDPALDSEEAHPVRQLLERTKRPLILDDPWNDDRLWESQRGILRAAELRSALVAPLVWEDDVVGLIGVASKREHAFGPSDAQFLAAVASQVTAIIRMATLLDGLQDTSSRLQLAREETVLLLAAAAEAHDQTTGRHLRNLHELTETLALELGHSELAAREMGIAAVLHDIGKLRVPESVLARPGKLADEEWELMKHHTTWGANFLDGHTGFELAAIIARSHHERWDGAGYPDGLAAEAIPDAATIVAVADAFDAMTSDRPYRKARSVAAAIREIEANAGEQFSPKVVDALKRLHRQQRLQFAQDEADISAA